MTETNLTPMTTIPPLDAAGKLLHFLQTSAAHNGLEMSASDPLFIAAQKLCDLVLAQTENDTIPSQHLLTFRQDILELIREGKKAHADLRVEKIGGDVEIFLNRHIQDYLRHPGARRQARMAAISLRSSLNG